MGRSRVGFHLFVSLLQLVNHNLEYCMFAFLYAGRSLEYDRIVKRIEKWKKREGWQVVIVG